MTGSSFPQLLAESSGERAEASAEQRLWGGKGDNVDMLGEHGAHLRSCTGRWRERKEIVSASGNTGQMWLANWEGS